MRRFGLAFAGCVLLSSACTGHHVTGEGQFGRPIPLMSGDDSSLPRLVFMDGGCGGPAGGCPDLSRCRPLLIDTLTPITALAAEREQPELDRACLEVRAAAGLATAEPSAQDLARAVARFRFEQVPLVRAPAGGTADWSWTAGDEREVVEPAGVLGGNVLRDFAVRLRTEAGVPKVAFFGAFPGADPDLAAQGRAFLPLQFPGRLLGRATGDACDIAGEDCGLGTFNLQPNQRDLALVPTRMVMDACMAMPPCTVRYRPDPDDPLAPGRCDLRRGPATDEACTPIESPGGGVPASLVLATGVPGMVLFEDSAVRMFGPLDALPSCDAGGADVPACVQGTDGRLELAGWPAAGVDEPLRRLRVRSLGLVPGATTSKAEGPCTRAVERLDGLRRQCVRYTEAVPADGTILDTAPPYAPFEDQQLDPASGDLAMVGEAFWGPGASAPDPARWIPTLVVPAGHPMPLALRRDVVPDAIQPDGLIGTGLLEGTELILDYTDINPGLRISCLDSASGRCLVAPDCEDDGEVSCCFGLPLTLLDEFINGIEDDSCCGALSAEALADVQAGGERCQGVDPP